MKDWKGFERGVAKALGEWWGCTFRRPPSSGAWGKQGQSRFSKSKAEDAAGDFHGDIVAPPEAQFPFSVECKCYKTVELYKMLYAKSNVFDWWAQCVRDTPKGMFAMLVMKENSKQALVVLSGSTFNKLFSDENMKHKCCPPRFFQFKMGRKSIYIMDLKAFIGSVPSVNFVKRVLNND
jgi:hypothetical protein